MGGVVDRRSGLPAYLQIANWLRSMIASGQLGPGEKLPSETALMETHKAARGTVRQAIATLRAEGLVNAEHGRGVFVRLQPPPHRKAHDRLRRSRREEGKAAYLADLEAEGRQPDVEVLKVGREAAPAEVAPLLNLGEGDPVLVRRRRYLADGQPMQLAASYLPWDIVKGTAIARKNTGPGGIYARLEEIGYRLKRFTEDIRARMPLPEETRALDLAPGVPVLTLQRIAYTEEDTPIEVCDIVLAADRYVLSYELPPD